MTRLLVGTGGPQTSERLLDCLGGALADDDEVCIVTSQPGGDETTNDEMADGEAALDVLADGLGGAVVERHRYVRGNGPVEDLLAAAEEFDIGEYVIGIRKRSPVGELVFGSTAQNPLLEADRAVRCVPVVG